MNKHVSVILFLLLCVFSIGASAVEEKKETGEMRIVSLAPDVTETIYELGCIDNLVGRTDYCNWPSQVERITSIGNMINPNMELIVSLQPDVVIASSIAEPDFFSKLNDTKIKTYRFHEEYNGINGSYNFIKDIGKVIGKEKEADALVRRNKTIIDSISEKTSHIEKKKKCVLLISWGDYGDYAATGDSYINEMIEVAGGQNIAENLKLWSISKELLLKEDPEVIILSTLPGKTKKETVENFIKTKPYDRLSGQIVAIDADKVQRLGVRTAEAVEEMAKLIYPELF